MTTTPPTTPIDDPPTPEMEHSANKSEITHKTKAKPRVKTSSTQKFPTHDDEGQRIRPPPSREKPTRPETPDEFWSNTLKHMKAKKDK